MFWGTYTCRFWYFFINNLVKNLPSRFHIRFNIFQFPNIVGWFGNSKWMIYLTYCYIFYNKIQFQGLHKYCLYNLFFLFIDFEIPFDNQGLFARWCFCFICLIGKLVLYIWVNFEWNVWYDWFGSWNPSSSNQLTADSFSLNLFRLCSFFSRTVIVSFFLFTVW